MSSQHSQNDDLEAARTSTTTPSKHPLMPGFDNPPPFLVFLRHSWYDIATQLACLLTSLMIYTYCPPLMPRYFPVFPGVYQTSWGMQHSQPRLAEYISTIVSAIVSFAVPALVMGAIALWGTRGFGDANAALIGLGYALSTATLFQSLLKICIGGLRPHFLTVCAPVIPPSLPGIGPGKVWYKAEQVCTGSSSHIKEAQMSFPSGHSCAAFAGFGFLALYINAKFKVLSDGGHFRDYYGDKEQDAGTARVRHWKLAMFVTPWCIAFLFALSKIRDRWHHPIDIIFGALVGTLFAHMAYRMCYRSVYDWRVNHIPLEGDGGDKDLAPKQD